MNLSGMPASTATEHQITNNGFYPDLNVAEFIENYAVATQYGNSIDMTAQKIALAIASVNKDLTIHFRTNWLGLNTLEDVPSDIVNDEKITTTLYKHAVFSLAKATLLISTLGETHRDKATVKALNSADSEQHWITQSNEAIAQITNRSKKLNVELL